MPYNLIDERWIPVERRSGRVELIAPAQVVEREDPPLRIASPRPDFDGALLEFLVGLLQTAAAPPSERAWEKELDEPPTVEALARRLLKVREAFFLDGDGPRFMQESGLTADNSKSKRIGYLLIDRAGEDSIAEGPSLFTKADQVPGLSSPAAATALYAMQSRAPSGGGGGGGHFTSVRGGAALSGLLLDETLWRTLWLNVIPMSEFCADEPAPDAGARTFPWMGRLPKAGRAGVPIPARFVHPAHAYWALPRRLLLVGASVRERCAVYPGADGPVWNALRTATVGLRYEGLVHPLAAYTRKSETAAWLPFLTPEEGFSYRDWPTLTQENANTRPPWVVSYFMRTRRKDRVASLRLAVFGFAMDNMKPLRWCRAETPLIAVRDALTSQFASMAGGLVSVSEDVRSSLCLQVKQAWFDHAKRIDLLSRINPSFWSHTERAFYAAVTSLKAALEADDSAALARTRETWLAELHRCALALFDEFVAAPVDLAAPDLRRAVKARRDLVRFTHPSSTKLRKLLGLPVEEPAPSDKAKRARRPRKEATT